MRALTIKQPWAGCIAHLDKRVENRTWRCPLEFIGASVAIHAGRSVEGQTISVPNGEKFGTLFASNAEWDAWRFWHLGDKPRDTANWPLKLTLSAVVAVATITGCHVRDPEEGCGDGSYAYGVICSPWAMPDQYHWVLDDVRPLAEPVPCRGMLGLWCLPDEVEQAIQEQLSEVPRG